MFLIKWPASGSTREVFLIKWPVSGCTRLRVCNKADGERLKAVLTKELQILGTYFASRHFKAERMWFDCTLCSDCRVSVFQAKRFIAGFHCRLEALGVKLGEV